MNSGPKKVCADQDPKGEIANYRDISKDPYNGSIRHHERGNASEEHYAVRKGKVDSATDLNWFAIMAGDAYFEAMSRKPIELPPAVGLAFVRDMKAFFAEQDPIMREAIAAEQMTVLQKYQGPREKPLRLIDVREMFREMKDHA